MPPVMVAHHVPAVMVVAHVMVVAMMMPPHVVMAAAVVVVHLHRGDRLGRAHGTRQDGRGGGGAGQAERGQDGERQQGLLQGRVPLFYVPPGLRGRQAFAAPGVGRGTVSQNPGATRRRQERPS